MKKSVTESMGIISPQALDRLWRERDPMARQRSSKPTFQAAVLKALSRGATIWAIEMALRANDKQGDGTRARGENFAKGACRVLNGGHWEDFMDPPETPEVSERRVVVTFGQLQKAVHALRRTGLRNHQDVVAFVMASPERAVLGFSFGPGDDQVVGIPGAPAP